MVTMEKWKKSFVLTLNREFEKIRNKNPRYSMRSYAKKLGLSIATLSEVSRHKSSLSPERAEKIIHAMELEPREKRKLLAMMDRKIEFELTPVPTEKQVSLSDWTTRAILYSFDLDHGQPSLSVLAKMLSLTETEVKQQIQTLIHEDFLKVDEKGTVYRPPNFWKTTDNHSSEFIRRFHRSNLSATAKAIDEIPTELRDITSLTFAGNSTQLEKVRAEIRIFYEKILAVMEEPSRDNVYQMTICLYPMNFSQNQTFKKEN